MCAKLLFFYAFTYNGFILAFHLVAAIAGGHDTNFRRYRGMVSIQRDEQHICGAGLISANWLLTSAKCIGDGAKGMTVRVGSGFLYNATSFEVEKAIPHPDYKPDAHDADIGLLYVSDNITDINSTETFMLPYGKNVEIPEAAHCDLIGWGKLANGSYPMQLQMGYVTVMSREACRKQYSEDLVTVDMFCVVSNLVRMEYNTIAACQGDFGGPVECYADGLNGLQGIASWGIGCKKTNNKPSVITKVGSYNDWIRNITGIVEPL